MKEEFYTKALASLQIAQPETWRDAIRRAHAEIVQSRKDNNLKDTKEGNAAAASFILGSMRGSAAGYYALRVATGLLEYKKAIEMRHLATETAAYRIQVQLDKLATMAWREDDKGVLSRFYTSRLAKLHTRAECCLQELIKTAKMLGTPTTLPAIDTTIAA